MNPGVFRIKFESSSVFGNGTVEVTYLLPSRSQSIVDPRLIGLQVRGCLQLPQGSSRVGRHQQGQSEVVAPIKTCWVQTNHGPKLSNRVFESRHLGPCGSKGIAGLDESRPEFNCLPKSSDRIRSVSFFAKHQSELKMGVRLIRVQSERFPQCPRGVFQIPLDEQCAAELDVRSHMAWVGCDRCSKLRDRQPTRASLPQKQAQVVPRFSVAGIGSRRVAEFLLGSIQLAEPYQHDA